VVIIPHHVAVPTITVLVKHIIPFPNMAILAIKGPLPWCWDNYSNFWDSWECNSRLDSALLQLLVVLLVFLVANKATLHVSAKARTVASRARTVASLIIDVASLIIVHVGTINSSNNSNNSILLLQKTEFGQQRDFFI
jgi:hypothetical protein